MENKIVALVVTFNRKELLIECLQALLNQRKTLNNIVVIDNNSTDGTEKLFEAAGEFVQSGIIFKRLEENIGGAGGFHEGIKYINENLDYNWIWLMDDDTIAHADSLSGLVNDLEVLKDEKISFLASSVYGPENEPMNVPDISIQKSKNGYPDWYRYLGEGLVNIKMATFVSLLISRKAIENVGYPIKSYFIWGDDTEYTLRLTKYYGSAFFSGNSKILHKRFNARSLSLIEEDNSNRIGMYKYFYRNNLLNYKEYFGFKVFLKKYISYFLLSFYIIIRRKTKFKWKKFKAIQTGWWNFTLRKYDYEEFKKRIPKTK